MRPALIALLLFALVAAGCGYQFPGRGSSLPEDIRKVELALFANGTSQPSVETEFTSRLTDEFIRQGALGIVSSGSAADAVLSGKVESYRSRALSYDGRDKITEYRSEMTVSAALRRSSTGQILWKGRVSRFEEYSANPDRSVERDNEQRAIDRLSDRLAKDLYARMMDNF